MYVSYYSSVTFQCCVPGLFAFRESLHADISQRAEKRGEQYKSKQEWKIKAFGEKNRNVGFLYKTTYVKYIQKNS